REAVRPGATLDRMRNVGQPPPGPRLLDAALERLPRRLQQLLCLRAHVPDRNGARRVDVQPVLLDADVETDNVAFPEGTIVGDSVHDLFVHRDAGRGRIPVKSLERGPAAARHNQLFDPGVEIAPRASRLDEITRQLEALDYDGAVRLHGHDVLR